eukprot:TRINITY_DN3586_c0_g1_i3.p1 TRINITY_DN3586_c0_g1~~TRINITY_DN3586_c0_g1_i3.p1  ORF type:complete len:269 (-),score=67.81 TRINITY_DN3586_c0_g1_i3:110-862(-)
MDQIPKEPYKRERKVGFGGDMSVNHEEGRPSSLPKPTMMLASPARNSIDVNIRGRSHSYAPLIMAESPRDPVPMPNAYKRKRTLKPAYSTKDRNGEAIPAFIGRIAAYCTSEMYELAELYDYFCHRGLTPTTTQGSVMAELKGSTGLVVFFTYGVVVMWGLTVVEERDLLGETDRFRVNPVGEVEVDDLEYTFGEAAKIVNDRLVMDDPNSMAKLAFSHAIAQSTRLSFFEDEVERMIIDTRWGGTSVKR